MQTDMGTSSDSLELSAWVPLAGAGGVAGPSVAGLTLNVSVVPLVRVGVFSPIAGMKTRLDLAALDASQLAKVTGSDPVYRVLRRPRLGKIRRIVRSSGSSPGSAVSERNASSASTSPTPAAAVREREVERFTHQELRAGLIYYVGKRSGQPGVSWSCVCVCSAAPARGGAVVTLVSR
jgi:chondroitin sulfate proteoglycan 4